MPALPRERFRRRLAALSRSGLRDLTADLWAARGFDTRDDGPVVVAADTDADAERTLVPVVSRRLRGPTRPPSGVDPDLVVDGSGSDAARAIAAEHGAAYVGPDDLYDRLLYGLDRDTGERLLDRHLGLPATVEPSAIDDVRDADGSDRPERSGGDGARADGTGGVGARAGGLLPDGGGLALGVVVGTVVLAAVVVGVGPDTVTDFGRNGDTGTVPEPTVDPAGANGTTPGESGALGATPDYPPGLSPEGVDASALRTAHESYLSSRSYTVVERTHADPELVPTGRWPSMQIVRRADSDGRYRVSATGHRPANSSNGSEAWYQVDGYWVGDRRYLRVNRSDEPVEYRVNRGDWRRQRASWRIEARLSGGNATVETVRTNAGRRFRVVVRDPPTDRLASAQGTVSDYRARATVHPDGYVLDLTVSYELRRDGAVGTRFTRLQYGSVGNTTVAEPAWIDEARANVSTAATTTDSDPGSENASASRGEAGAETRTGADA